MTGRLRASLIPGVLALGASGLGLGLTACSSQGTIGPSAGGGPLPGPATSSNQSSNPAPNSSPTATGAPASTGSSAPATSSAAAPNSTDPSALASSLKTLNQLWTDQGCKTALAGFSDYLYAQQRSPAQGIAAIPAAVPKIRAGAQQTTKPGAAQAMNKMAADMLTMSSQAQQGKTPDKGPVKNDFQIMANICSQQQL